MLSIEETIDKGLKNFVNKQEELLGILNEWKAKVLLLVQKRTRASFVVQTSSDSSLSVPLGDLDHLKILQWSLAITYMDKCCNNFVFVCKKFYVSSVFSELNSPVGTYVVSNLAQSNILNFHLSFNKAHNKVLSVALVSCFFVQFGSFIKTQSNLDLSVQPALLL
jgi:hypothetical protein